MDGYVDEGWLAVPEVKGDCFNRYRASQSAVRSPAANRGLRQLAHCKLKVTPGARDRLDGNVALTIQNRHQRHDLVAGQALSTVNPNF